MLKTINVNTRMHTINACNADDLSVWIEYILSITSSHFSGNEHCISWYCSYDPSIDRTILALRQAITWSNADLLSTHNIIQLQVSQYFLRILHFTNCKLIGNAFMSGSVHASRTFRSGLVLLIPVIHEAIVQKPLDKNINIVNLVVYSRVPVESLACMACALLDSMEVSFCYQTARMEIVYTVIIAGDTIFTSILNISSLFIRVCQFQTTIAQNENTGV